MNIALVTPARPGSRAGNRHTALRWAAILRAAGHRVSVSQEWNPENRADLLLALHARRSHASIKAFALRHPDRPIVLALTGTDVYRDIRRSPQARESLELADRLIVLQPKAAEELSRRFRKKVRVVVQSSSTRLRHRPVKHKFRICVIGHLRDEKDPMRTLAALSHVSEKDVQVIHLGAPFDPAIAAQAQAGMRHDPRYRWLGSVPHARALAWLASSHAMVVSSRMEGGANVVSEAIRVGVPVLASCISGNLGLLGEDYPAYYPLGNERALARLILRAARQPRFYAELRRRVARLRPMAAPRNEARLLLATLKLPRAGV